MHDPNIDTRFMREAIRQAKKGEGWTNPNPMVGAVIVKNEKIIAKGFHKKAGLPHAEIEALRAAREDVKGATIYVNLEPCSHFGRTPPCVNAIISSGIKRVVCSVIDSNPKVGGAGVALLKRAGIEVSSGILEDEARKLNEAFFTFHIKKRPFIAMKFAASLDGKIATKNKDSKWITSEAARNYVGRLRNRYQAILVGINTVLNDNPYLSTRMKKGHDPLRIILDSSLKIPLEGQALRDSNVLIATTEKANPHKKVLLKQKGINVVICGKTDISLDLLMQELVKQEVISVFVEGGSAVHGSFIDSKLVDKFYAFYAPMLIGGEEAISAIGGRGADTIKEALRLTDISYKHFGDCMLTIGYPIL